MERHTVLSEAQRAERERIAEMKHREFLRSLATSHSVKMQQSSVAGASAKTNQTVRIAEEQEAERQARLLTAAQTAAADKNYLAKVNSVNDAIASRQSKKRAKRNKRQESKISRKRPRSGSESSTTGSEDSDVSGGEDDVVTTGDHMP